MDKFGQEVWESHIVGLSQDLEFAFDYFYIVDDDIGGVKFDKQFIDYNPLLLIWISQIDKEDLHP